MRERNARISPRITAALGLILILFGFSFLARPFRSLLNISGVRWSLHFQLAWDWVIVAILLAIVLLIERQPLSSIGIHRLTLRHALAGIGVFLGGGLIFMVTAPLLQAVGAGTTQSGVSQLAELSVATRIATVITAGIAEEIIFRGYLIERLIVLLGKVWLAAAVSLTIFVLGHLSFWGVGGTIQIGLGALLLTVLYAFTRSVPACALAHVLNHIVAFLVIPVFIEL